FDQRIGVEVEHALLIRAIRENSHLELRQWIHWSGECNSGKKKGNRGFCPGVTSGTVSGTARSFALQLFFQPVQRQGVHDILLREPAFARDAGAKTQVADVLK